MSLIPVKLYSPDVAVGQSDQRSALQLSPTPTAIRLLQLGKRSYPTPYRNGLDCFNGTDDLEIHSQ